MLALRNKEKENETKKPGLWMWTRMRMKRMMIRRTKGEEEKTEE